MSGPVSISSTCSAPATYGLLPPVNPALPLLWLSVDPAATRDMTVRIRLAWTPAGIASVGSMPDAWIDIGPDLGTPDPITDVSVTTATNYAIFGAVGANFTLTRNASGPVPLPGT